MILIFSTEGRGEELEQFFSEFKTNIQPAVGVAPSGNDEHGPWALVYRQEEDGAGNFVQAAGEDAVKYLDTFDGFEVDITKNPNTLTYVDFDALLGDYE